MKPMCAHAPLVDTMLATSRLAWLLGHSPDSQHGAPMDFGGLGSPLDPWGDLERGGHFSGVSWG